MESIDVDGLVVAYERRGSGPSVVLVHGYVGDGVLTWRPQLEGLADGFDVIAWDLPGAGGSDDPPESFGMGGFADALAGFVNALGLDRPHMVGLSFGGVTLIEFCRRHLELGYKTPLRHEQVFDAECSGDGRGGESNSAVRSVPTYMVVSWARLSGAHDVSPCVSASSDR